MKKEIEEILNGKPLNWQTVHELQRDPRMGLSKSGAIDASKMDASFAAGVRAAAQELVRREDPKNKVNDVKEWPELNVDFLRSKMKDKRYSGTISERDPAYIQAIEDGFRFLYEDDGKVKK